jgi:hypothetical protein
MDTPCVSAACRGMFLPAASSRGQAWWPYSDASAEGAGQGKFRARACATAGMPPKPFLTPGTEAAVVADPEKPPS